MFEEEISREIDDLYLSSEDVSDRRFTYADLNGLPEPVQRYLRLSIPEDSRHISSTRLRHEGGFKTLANQPWAHLEGEEYFITSRPGFLWNAIIKPLPIAWVRLRDMYLKGEGAFSVKLFSRLGLKETKGEDISKAGLLRWLSEAVWYPTALLESEYLRWEEIDESCSGVYLSDSEISVEGVFHFNRKGEITRFDAQRYHETKPESWSVHYRDYREVNGFNIPFESESVWKLEGFDFTYAHLILKDLDFDIAREYERL